MMIRRLREHDRDGLMLYLSEEPSINQFIIGDVEAFGFNSDFQVVWGQFDGEHALNAVLLKYKDHYIPYAKSDQVDLTDIIQMLLAVEGRMRISGKKSVMDRIEPYVQGFSYKDYFFCELKALVYKQCSVNDVSVLTATIEDASRIYDFVDTIKEFSGFDNQAEHYRHRIKTDTGRIYYVQNRQKEIMSVVQTTAENSMSAMIVGVATNKQYRGQGLMRLCLTKLCMDLIEEGKRCCLFYNNPRAGNVYLNMGFEPIDNWVMMTRA